METETREDAVVSQVRDEHLHNQGWKEDAVVSCAVCWATLRAGKAAYLSLTTVYS